MTALLLCLLIPPPAAPPARPEVPPRVLGRWESPGGEAAVIDTDTAVYLDGERAGWRDVAGATLRRVQLDRTETQVLRLWFESPAKEAGK